MITSDKVKSIIISQINQEIAAACERENVSNLEYEELLDVLVEVSKLEAITTPTK
jgi:hypothetical protein